MTWQLRYTSGKLFHNAEKFSSYDEALAFYTKRKSVYKGGFAMWLVEL